MNYDLLLEAKDSIKGGTPGHISELEEVLEDDGFRETIIPGKLAYYPWYIQHIHHEPDDKTNYLLPYSGGFAKRNITTQAIAGYGVISEIHTASTAGLIRIEPHHFFFIEHTESVGDNIEMVNYLAEKARNCPDNPAYFNPAKSWADKPSPNGSMPVFWGCMAFGIGSGSALIDSFGILSQLHTTYNADLLLLGGLALTSWAVSRSRPVQGMLKKIGLEDYEAPAKSSTTRPEYGISGLERYSFCHP